MCKKIFILFLILCLLTTLIGCRGAPTVPPISPEPEVSFSEEFVLVQVIDPESNIIFVTGKENEDAMAVIGDKDTEGNPTNITGAVYVSEQEDSFSIEAGIDGLPAYMKDSKGNIVIFENYTNSTADISIYDSNGNFIQEPITINIEPEDLLELKQLYNSFYSKGLRWSRKNTADALKWGAVGLSAVGCGLALYGTYQTAGFLALTPAVGWACGKASLSLIAAITPNDTDNLISIGIGTGSCLISGGADVWGCESTILSIIAYGEGQSIPTTSSLTPTEIELIRKWGFGGDYVVRWPNGYVDVYDETNYSRMQEVLNQWNSAIGGPVVFRLSSNPNSPVKVIFDSSLELENLCFTQNWLWGDDYTFSEVIIKINPSGSCCGDPNTKYCLYLVAFRRAAGFAGWTTKYIIPFEEWTNFNTINDTMKKMVKALHKVPPGYYLGSSKPGRDYSFFLIEDVLTNVVGSYLGEDRK